MVIQILYEKTYYTKIVIQSLEKYFQCVRMDVNRISRVAIYVVIITVSLFGKRNLLTQTIMTDSTETKKTYCTIRKAPTQCRNRTLHTLRVVRRYHIYTVLYARRSDKFNLKVAP